MTDFHPILVRAISALPQNTVDARAVIYTRAREALERQLRSVVPALQDADILGEQLALENAIQQIEDEQRPSLNQSDTIVANRQPAASQDQVSPHKDSYQPVLHPPKRDIHPGGHEPHLDDDIVPQNAQRLHFNTKKSKLPQKSGVPFDKARPPSDETIGVLKRNKIFIGVALVAMILVGSVALITREKPSLYATKSDSSSASTDANKTEGRLNSSEQGTNTPSGKDNNSTILPVLARAFMVLEVPNAAPNQYQGSIIWEFAPDSGSKSVEKMIRAQINFPNGGMKIDFSINKNVDTALDVSHTALIVFETAPTLGAVKDMSAIEWRERESQAGTVLQGTLVPVQDNFFTLGLDKSQAAVANNLDLFRNQKWMVFEMRFANGRRGAVLLEKGATGERVIAEALRAWQ